MYHNTHRSHTVSSSQYLPIEDYAIIGDLHTVALVGKNGSLDWCCLPDFDSPSVFGALLDAEKGGFFRIAPRDIEHMRYTQMYLPETNILLTRFLGVDGVAEITDFMPIRSDNKQKQQIIRSVALIRGSLSFELTCRPAFNYARSPHNLDLSSNCVLFHGPKLHLALASPHPIEEDGHGGVHASFTLQEGQTAHFILEQTDAGADAPQPITDSLYHELFQKTLHYWRRWLAQCTYSGRWREMVQRSALVLKLLTYEPTGAIIAAPTTSLPEEIGGERNWDYRYTWLRDASFSLYSLLSLGLTDEADAFMGWLEARCHELHDGGTLQPMYGIRGEHQLAEIELDHLEGYRGSKPVRIGNGAYNQLQLDIYGMLMDAIYVYNRYSSISYDLWQNLRRLLGWLEQHWQEPDNGIWEIRGKRQHFVNSRLMSWVAFDRAQRLARHRGLPAPLTQWTKTSTDIYEQIMKQGWHEGTQSFTQYYGSDAVDASELLMSITHFTGAGEPRMQATVDRIQRELVRGALVHRYDPQKAASDGVSGTEGTFGACSFWLAETLARAGHLQEARLMLEKMLTYSNHVGLYAEEIGPSGEALGNYPQAFTHLSLITACYNIDCKLNERRDGNTL
jgi:GH15 family glucan-1,4-alpha-glucosidase